METERDGAGPAKDLSLQMPATTDGIDLTRLEKRMKKALKQLGDHEANLWSLYVRARIKIFDDVLPNIPGVEPSLTDHSEKHVRHVLDNANALLFGDAADEKTKKSRLNGAELYVLCLSILFHDVGNVYGRKNHEKMVGLVYAYVREGETSPPRERSMVIAITGSHTGQTRCGSDDTLSNLSEEHLHGQSVRVQEIAAILRFADELAEGSVRTSQFMRKQNLYSTDSERYHDYASITIVTIDRGNGRVALTYEFSLEGEYDSEKAEQFRELLAYAYSRVLKLDQERKYCKYYSELLAVFRETSVRLAFWFDKGQEHDLDLKPMVLTDKQIPGVLERKFDELFPDYALEAICSKVSKEKCSK